MSVSGRRIARIGLVNLAILFAGVVILELGFGGWLRNNGMNRLNLIRDVQLSYDAAGLYRSPDTRIIYTRDAYGFRGTYPRLDAIDILTIGGSATDQRYITDRATWQEVLRNAFAAEGTPVSVVNAGVDGQSTVGHIRNFDWWFPNVPGLRARFHLFYIGTNDFFTRPDLDEIVATPSWAGRLRQKSALYTLFVKMRGIYVAQVVARVGHRAVDFSAVEWTERPLLQDHAAMARAAADRYGQRLRSLLARSTAAGATPICVTQGVRIYRVENGRVSGLSQRFGFEGTEVNGVDYFLLMRHFDRLTLDVCGQFGGIGLDAARDVNWADADFYDFVHNTPQGSRRLGEYLHAQLRTRW